MIRRACLAVAAVGLCSCLGAQNRGDLMILVQRVELLPGVDALDPIDPTPVGQDLRQIRFYLTEPLSEATVAAFDPATHLELDGLELDPASPPVFNATSVGLIPPRAILTLTLDPAGDGLLPEGTYRLRLKSPEESRLVAELSGTEFKGSFRFVISVVARDGKLPYLVRFRAGDVIVGEEIPPELLIGVMEEGLAGASSPIPPHARLVAEFSERMRVPLPFAVTPVLDSPVSVTVEKEDGTRLTLGTKAPVYPGIDFQDDVESVEWIDTVDGVNNRLTTILASETEEGLEVDTTYNVRFAGFSGGLSQQAVARDRSGEPLTVRVGRNDPNEQANEAAIEYYSAFRDGPMNDRRFFRTAPIRINAPIHPTTLNRDAFGGMALNLVVGGEAADSVTSMEVSIRRAGATIVTPIGIAPTVVGAMNRVGVPINLFLANVALPVSIPDGEYELIAESFALGNSKGYDSVRLHKDTTPPEVFSGGDFSVLGTDTLVEDFCVVASEDTVKVEILLDPAGDPIAVSGSRTDIFGGSLSVRRGRFCFAPFSVPFQFGYGKSTWYLRLTDEAGNATDPPLQAFLRRRPVISAISPSPAVPGAEVEIIGPGLSALTVGGSSISFNGFEVPLIHGFRASDPLGPGIIRSAGETEPYERAVIRAPDFAESGPVFVRLYDGTTSTPWPLTLLLDPPSPFIHDGLAPRRNFPILLDSFSTSVAGSTSVPEIASAPASYVFRTIGGTQHRSAFTAGPVVAYVSRAGATTGVRSVVVATWTGSTWHRESVESFPEENVDVAQVGLTRIPGGDLVLASRAPAGGQTTVNVRRRTSPCCTGSRPEWIDSGVIAFSSLPADVPAALAIAAAADGRVAVVYSARGQLGTPSLLAAIESAPGTGDFSNVFELDSIVQVNRGNDEEGAEQLLDLFPARASAAFDPAGRLNVAWNHAMRRAGGEPRPTSTNVRVARISLTGEVEFLPEISPGGVWPDLAIGPSGRVRVLLQEYAASTVLDVNDVVIREFGGASWSREVVEARPLDRILAGVGETFVDPNSLIARSSLEIAPDGSSRVVYARGDGTAVFGKQLDTGSWTRQPVAVHHRLSSGVSLALDAVGTARVLSDDASTGRSLLRLNREEDGSSIFPEFGSGLRPVPKFERMTVPPYITDFSLANTRHPLTLEWLLDLPDYSLLLNDPPPADVLIDARQVYTTLLAGESTSGPSSYRFDTSGMEKNLVAQIPFGRNTGLRELETLTGRMVTDTNGNPTRIDVGGRIAGNENMFRFEFRVIPVGLPTFRCVSPDGTENNAPSVCGMTQADVTQIINFGAINAGSPAQRLGALGVMLMPLPDAESLKEKDVVVDSLSIDLHGLGFFTGDREHEAGEAGFEVGVSRLRIEARSIRDGPICSTTPVHIEERVGQRVRLTGPFAARRGTIYGLDGDMTGHASLLDFSALFVPALKPNSIGGSEQCRAFISTLEMFKNLGITESSPRDPIDVPFRLSGRAGRRALLWMLHDPAFDSSLRAFGAQDPWAVQVTPAGDISVVRPLP